jgi:hypothetical protein
MQDFPAKTCDDKTCDDKTRGDKTCGDKTCGKAHHVLAAGVLREADKNEF